MTNNIKSFFREIRRLLFKSKRRELRTIKAIRHFRRHGHIHPLMPQSIQIQTHSFCNGRCLYCPYPDLKDRLKQGKMDRALVVKIAEEVSSWDIPPEIEIMLQNEPFMDKEFFKTVRYFKTIAPRIRVSTVTNGTLLTRPVVEQIAGSGLDELKISLDAFSKNTYETLHPGFSFDGIMDVIDRVSGIKDDQLVVKLSFVCTNLNKDELADFIAFAKEKGLGWRTIQLLNRAGNVKKYSRFSLARYAWHPFKLHLLYKYFYSACPLPFTRTAVLFNGDVIICCQDWRRQVVAGNINTSSLAEIWNSDVYDNLRRKIVKKSYHEITSCSGCTLAQLSM